MERLVASDLSIAVDPRDSRRVWVAWGDRPAGTTNLTLHVRRSTDRGQTWSRRPADRREREGAGRRREQPRPRRVPLPAADGHRAEPALGDAGRADRQRLRLVHDDGPRDGAGEHARAAVPPLPRRLHGHEVAGQGLLRDLLREQHAEHSRTSRSASRTSATRTSRPRRCSPPTASPPSRPPSTRSSSSSRSSPQRRTSTSPTGRTARRSSTSASSRPRSRSSTTAATSGTAWRTRPGAFDGNNRPLNEPPRNGPGIFGRQLRVRPHPPARRPARAVSVTAHFLVSRFGTGSNYMNAGAPPRTRCVNFAAGDDVLTMAAGYPGISPSTSSSHLCLAVEIATPQDPLVPPSLSVARRAGRPPTCWSSTTTTRHSGTWASARRRSPGWLTTGTR